MHRAKFVVAIALLAAIAAPPVHAQAADSPVSLLPDQVNWNPMPAGAMHYVFAKDGEVVFQESGSGPTESMFLKK